MAKLRNHNRVQPIDNWTPPGGLGWHAIGLLIGTTGERARQIANIALYKLRHHPDARELFEEAGELSRRSM